MQRNFHDELIAGLESEPMDFFSGFSKFSLLHCVEIFPHGLLNSILWKFKINLVLYINALFWLFMA